MIDDDQAARRGRKNAVSAKHDLLDIGSVRHADEDDLGVARGFGRALSPLGALGEERLGAGFGSSVDAERISGGEETATGGAFPSW